MKAKELRNLSDEELIAKEEELERMIVEARIKRSLGQITDTQYVKRLKRDLARVKTLIREREIERGLEKGGLRRLVAQQKKEKLGIAEKPEEKKEKKPGLVERLLGKK